MAPLPSQTQRVPSGSDGQRKDGRRKDGSVDADSQMAEREESMIEESMIDQSLEESFPASDPRAGWFQSVSELRNGEPQCE